MALQFRDSIKYLFLHSGMLFGMSGWNGGYQLSQPAIYTSCTIFGGTRATAAQLLASWSTYNSTNNPNLLAHYTSAQWHIPNVTTSSGNVLTIITLPANSTPLNTGVGSWAVLWNNNANQASLSSTTIPSTSFIVVDISDLAGTGVLKFNSLSFVAGIPHAMHAGSMYSAWV